MCVLNQPTSQTNTGADHTAGVCGVQHAMQNLPEPESGAAHALHSLGAVRSEVFGIPLVVTLATRAVGEGTGVIGT